MIKYLQPPAGAASDASEKGAEMLPADDQARVLRLSLKGQSACHGGRIRRSEREVDAGVAENERGGAIYSRGLIFAIANMAEFGQCVGLVLGTAGAVAGERAER
jgi:hypothetical protein